MSAVESAPVLRAARCQPTEVTPVWFMRQAGRYLPEYRDIRSRHSLLEICAQPALAAEVTLQPVRRLGVDAAILFADILLPLVPMGLDLSFAAGEGPVIRNPLRDAAHVAALRPVDAAEAFASICEAVRIVRGELSAQVPLIGFAGGPFTVASYAIEGGSTRHFLETKRLMLGAPLVWDDLMRRLTDVIVSYVTAQVGAGVQLVQIFDSWAGALDPFDYRRFVLPHTRRVFEALSTLGVPSIHFGVGTATLLEPMREAGGDIMGIDWRIPLDAAWDRLGPRTAIQGNLDPAALLAPLPELTSRVTEILRRARRRKGHIFNLGHGVPPSAPVDHVRAVVDLVHEISARDARA